MAVAQKPRKKKAPGVAIVAIWVHREQGVDFKRGWKQSPQAMATDKVSVTIQRVSGTVPRAVKAEYRKQTPRGCIANHGGLASRYLCLPFIISQNSATALLDFPGSQFLGLVTQMSLHQVSPGYCWWLALVFGALQNALVTAWTVRGTVFPKRYLLIHDSLAESAISCCNPFVFSPLYVNHHRQDIISGELRSGTADKCTKRMILLCISGGKEVMLWGPTARER